MEEQLRTLWSQVLNINGSDIQDETDFFQAGGDSVTSITLSGRANDAGLELFPQTIFDNPVFLDMAKKTMLKSGSRQEEISSENAVGSKNAMDSWDLIKTSLLQCNITHHELEDIYPCAPFQEELMRSSNDSGLWSYQTFFKIDGEASLPRAKQAFELTWQRNSVFRSRIVQFGPTTYQVIVKNRIEWKEYEGELAKFHETELSKRFRYGEPTCRLAVVRDAGTLYIVWTKTHAIHDLWSTMELMPDLRAAFVDPSAFAATNLRPSHREFVDFIAQYRRSGMRYWKEQLAGLKDWDHLWPDDTRKPWTYATAKNKRYLKTVEYKQIKTRHAGLDALGQAAWILTLANEIQKDTVFFMQTRTCRRMPLGGIDRIIGPCWSPCPVRATLSAKDTLDAFMMSISKKANDAAAYDPFGLPAALEHFGHRRFLQFVLTVQPPEQDNIKETITTQESDGRQISMQTVTPLESISGHYGFSNTLTPTTDGNVIISVRYDDAFIDDDRVGVLVDKFAVMFAGILDREWSTLQLSELCPHLLPDRSSLHHPIKGDTAPTLSAVVRKGSQASALVITGREPLVLNHGYLHKMVNQMQRRFAKLGIGRGSSACIVLPNSLEYIVAFLALTWQRAVATPLNPAYKQDEFDFFIGDLESDILIIPQGTYKVQGPAVRAARKYEAAIVECYWDGEMVALDVKEEGTMATVEEQEVLQAKLGDVALTLHTSGTTGRPKAVPLTHNNLVRSAQNMSRTYELTPKDRTMAILPLFHVHGLVAFLSALYSGGSAIVPERLTPEFWRTVEQHRATWYTATPSVHRVILRFPPPSAKALDRVRFIRSSSAHLPATLFKQLEEAYDVPVLASYGMTESSSLITSNLLPPLKRLPYSVGKAQGVTLQILDHEGKSVAPGEVGEVSIRGETVTNGYLNNVDANKSSFTAEGFFRTGDVGKLDQDGYLTLTGRLKEMINKGGDKISPVELDDLINQHGSVSEAVTFAIEDEAYGQNVACAVKLAVGKQLSEQELRKWVAERLSAFKAPSKVWFLEEMPLAATGKVQRRAVAEAVAKQ